MGGRDNGTRNVASKATDAESVASHEARYQYERRLGTGGSGAVFLVRDLETGEQLALKQLLHVDAKSVLRLKREFRSMQSVNHPHIIKLYDMGQVDDTWFLTMEYLAGVDLTTYLTRQARVAESIAQSIANLNGAPDARLLSAFRQLARGVHALHEAGMLHRDLKPSNVIVVDHRVVVLDFGLVRQLSVEEQTLTEDGSVAGTPAYMAPEQLMAKELTAATDWYAFGVMLYEALSGTLPFDGPLLSVMHAKVDRDPMPLEAKVPHAPRWICDLCSALLSRDPALRPSGDAVLAQFDAANPTSGVTPTSTENIPQTEREAQERQATLFGREREIALLEHAFERAEDGQTVVVHVRAASGAGKSALVDHFVDELPWRGGAAGAGNALVLRSRCYELEAMPFKALDGLMDSLIAHLLRLDDVQVAHLMPTDVAALARVFPAFERLNAVKRLAASAKSIQDALQTRRRAEAALRRLLENLAMQAPTVLWIDDLQWGDLDSAQVLRSWLLQPSAAPMLFIFSYRADEVGTSTCLRALLEGDRDQPPLAIDNVIDVSPLPQAQVRAMCELQLRTKSALRDTIIERIVREAHGSPFFASQLIALADAKTARGDTDLESLSVNLMVAQTSALLANDAKVLLAMLAVAGRPMSPKLALKAAGIKEGGRGLVRDLRGLNLVRSRDVGGVRMIEVYHDRIRELVRDGLTPDESRQLYDGLFRTLEWSGQADPDWLHALAAGAGHAAQAIQYGKAAAARATASLAFERASRLYRTCIVLDPEAGAPLWKELAAALARAGRGAEAAEAALEVAKQVPAGEALNWRMLAAAHYMRSGHFVQGEALIREVLDAAGISVPSSESGVMAAIGWERFRLKLRGTRATPRPSGEYPADLVQRCDLLMALWTATQASDPMLALLFQTRAFRAALDAGEPLRIVRSLCAVSMSLAFVGTLASVRASDDFVARAAAINSALPNPDECMMLSTRAINAFLVGRLHEAVEYADAAERLFRMDVQDDPSGNYNRRIITTSVRLALLHLVGDYERLARELHAVIEDAHATGNRAALLQMSYMQTVVEQVQGLGERSVQRLDAQRTELPARLGSAVILHMCAVMMAACWVRDYTWAKETIGETWKRFLRSSARGSTTLSSVGYHAHARLLLNEHVEAGVGPGVFAHVASDIHALEKLPGSTPIAMGRRLRARLAYLKGDSIEAIAHFRSTVAEYEQAGNPHEANRDRFALGAVIGGKEGAELRARARAELAALGLKDVETDLRASYPEAWKAEANASR